MTHLNNCDKRCMLPLQHCSSLHGHLFSSLPSCLGEWGGRGLWLESFVQWGVTETRGSGQNIDRYVINVSEPHIRTVMYKSYFCSVWGVGFFYCREKNVLCICGSVYIGYWFLPFHLWLLDSSWQKDGFLRTKEFFSWILKLQHSHYLCYGYCIFILKPSDCQWTLVRDTKFILLWFGIWIKSF